MSEAIPAEGPFVVEVQPVVGAVESNEVAVVEDAAANDTANVEAQAPLCEAVEEAPEVATEEAKPTAVDVQEEVVAGVDNANDSATEAQVQREEQSRSRSRSRATSASDLGKSSRDPEGEYYRAGSNDSRVQWMEERQRVAGGKRNREEGDDNSGKKTQHAEGTPSPVPTRIGNANTSKATKLSNNNKTPQPDFPWGDQYEFVAPCEQHRLLVEPGAKIPMLERFRTLLSLIPDDDRLCSLHLSHPPLPLPPGPESPTLHTGKVPTSYPLFPGIEVIKRFFSRQGYAVFVQPLVRRSNTGFHDIFCQVDFEVREEAIRAFLSIGVMAKIGDSVLRIGWGKTFSSKAPALVRQYNSEEKMYIENLAYFLKTPGPHSNAEWHTFQEAERARLAPPRPPTPPPTRVSGAPVDSPIFATGAFGGQFVEDAPISPSPSSYLPASFKQPSVPAKTQIENHVAGPMRSVQSRAHQSKELPRVILREFGAPRILSEPADHIRYNRNVLQLTTAVDPLMNFEALNGQGVYCDAPMYALPFEDEKAVYDAVSQFGEINGITFTPERRAVFVTFARPQSVTAAVLRAKQSSWLEGGVRASALGHSTQGK